MSSDPTRRAGLRVGHAERRQVVQILQQQYAEGRLVDAELEERSAAALAATSFADLDRLVADLPVPAARAGMRPDHRLSMSAGLSSHVRRGVWEVPPFLSLSGGVGSVRLDFQGAICPYPVVDIAVSGGAGSIVIVVPAGWAANTDQVGKGIGAVVNTVSSVPASGRPLLVLHGSSMMGTIKVRYPNWNDRRVARKALARDDSRTATGRPVPVDPSTAGPQDTPLP